MGNFNNPNQNAGKKDQGNNSQKNPPSQNFKNPLQGDKNRTC